MAAKRATAKAAEAFDTIVDFLESFEELDDPRQRQFQSCFIAWVAGLTKLEADIIAIDIAIDGKTLRRSYQEGGAKAPIHMIPAWSCRQNLVLGQAKVAAKSNEITAIPQLLDLLTVEAAVITIDAMGCQRDRSQDHREEGGLCACAQGQPGHAARRR